MPELDAKQKRVMHAYKAFAFTVNGQIILADLAAKYGNRRSFVPGDPHATSFHEGQRDVYIHFLHYVNQPLEDGEPIKPKRRSRG